MKRDAWKRKKGGWRRKLGTAGKTFSKKIHITNRGCRSSRARRQLIAMENSLTRQLDRTGMIVPKFKTSHWGRS